jgi:hypothetical protein
LRSSPPSWRKPRWRVAFHAGSASSASLTCRCYGPSNGAPWAAGANSAAGRTQVIDATAIHCNPSSALNWRPRSLGSCVFIWWSGKWIFAR